MSISRRARRQSDQGAYKLFTLFDKFSTFVTRNHSVSQGILSFDEEVSMLYGQLHHEWIYYVKNHRRNNKKVIDLGMDAFKLKADQFISGLKKQYWQTYMVPFMDDKYGIDATIDELEGYYQEDKEPNEAGVEMVMDVETLNYAHH